MSGVINLTKAVKIPATVKINITWTAPFENWLVMGGFSRCDKHFFRTKEPQSVISYVDLSISTGATELMFPGWACLTTNKPSGTWVYMGSDKTRPKFIKDRSAQRLSADKLLGFEVGEKYPKTTPEGLKITNEFVLLSEDYVKVFDAGTRTFAWGLPEAARPNK